MTSHDHLPLADHLCFSVYATDIAINRAYKPMLDAMGITYPQYLVLTALAESDGLTVGAIAERLMLESSTVTPPVKRLEQAGLVIRKRGTEDERQVNVWLTDAGRDLLGESKCLGETLLARSGMTTTEFNAFNKQLRQLLKALSPKA